jgi:hypothetical protein
VGLKHLSGGRIISAMYRSSVKIALNSSVKTPDLGSYVQIRSNPGSDSYQNLRQLRFEYFSVFTLLFILYKRTLLGDTRYNNMNKVFDHRNLLYRKVSKKTAFCNKRSTDFRNNKKEKFIAFNKQHCMFEQAFKSFFFSFILQNLSEDVNKKNIKN